MAFGTGFSSNFFWNVTCVPFTTIFSIVSLFDVSTAFRGMEADLYFVASSGIISILQTGLMRSGPSADRSIGWRYTVARTLSVTVS